MRILFDARPKAAHRNPWNVKAKDVIFADAAAPDPPAASLAYVVPRPDSSDDDEPEGSVNANVKKLEALMRSVSRGVDPTAVERSLSTPIFPNGAPHPRLYQVRSFTAVTPVAPVVPVAAVAAVAPVIFVHSSYSHAPPAALPSTLIHTGCSRCTRYARSHPLRPSR